MDSIENQFELHPNTSTIDIEITSLNTNMNTKIADQRLLGSFTIGRYKMIKINQPDNP